MENSEDKAEIIAKSLLAYLKKNKQSELLDLVIKKLKAKSKVDNKVIVTTPIVLSKVQKAKAIRLVSQLIKKDFVEIEFKEDSGILDGMIIKFNDKVWDISLAGEIGDLVEKLGKN